MWQESLSSVVKHCVVYACEEEAFVAGESGHIDMGKYDLYMV